MITLTDQSATPQGRLRLLLDKSCDLDVMDELATAIRNQPHDVALRFLACEVSERLGAIPEAADHLTTIIRDEPQHLRANQKLALLLAELGDTSGAIRCCRRVVENTGTEDTDAITLLAIAFSKGGQHDAAVELLKECSLAHPTAAEVFANLGVALSAAGRDSEASAALNRALELDPRSAQAHCGQGVICYKEARWEDAVAAFQMTEHLAPILAVGSFNLGLALEHLGDREGARRAILRAAALEPEDDEIQRVLEPLLVTQSSAVDIQDSEGLGPSMEGSLEGFDLLNVMEFLRLQDKSGSLVITTQSGRGIILLESGMIIGGSGPGIRPLGDVLVNRQLTSREVLWRIRSQHQELDPETEMNSTNLVLILLREHLVDENELRKLLFQVILDVTVQVTQWRDGVFAFHPSKDHSFPIRFNVQEVILELMRREDEKNRSPSEFPQ